VQNKSLRYILHTHCVNPRCMPKNGSPFLHSSCILYVMPLNPIEYPFFMHVYTFIVYIASLQDNANINSQFMALIAIFRPIYCCCYSIAYKHVSHLTFNSVRAESTKSPLHNVLIQLVGNIKWWTNFGKKFRNLL